VLGLYKVDVNGHARYMSEEASENTSFELGGGNDTLGSRVCENVFAA
jgi:hypothetical protein